MPPPPPPRYVLEPAWRAGDVWFYPHETFSLDQTGLAAILPPGHAPLTTDGEAYDSDAMAAAMQAVQLPAIAEVTNLDTGLQLTLRVNDRGPGDPGRLIAVTPRVARLLDFAGPTARVRVRFDPEASAAVAHQVQGHAGDLALTTAPRNTVQQTTLAPLAGTTTEAARQAAGLTIAQATETAAIIVPRRLPERLVQGAARLGVLGIDAGSFTHDNAARQRLAAIGDPSARLIGTRAGGQTTYAIALGPYAAVADADAALARLVASGITDARIVIDLR